MAEPITVVLVEDHDMVREGLLALLSADERLNVVGSASSLALFRAQLADWQPDVVVVDYQLPDGKGTELAAECRASGIDCAVLLISGLDDAAVLEESIASGCAGFLSKGAGTADLADAIVTINRGATVFPADALRRFALRESTGEGFALTNREMEVLRLLANAHPVVEIAELLTVSISTARNHVQAVLTKLGARSQLDAVVIGVRAGIVDIGTGADPAD